MLVLEKNGEGRIVNTQRFVFDSIAGRVACGCVQETAEAHRDRHCVHDALLSRTYRLHSSTPQPAGPPCQLEHSS